MSHEYVAETYGLDPAAHPNEVQMQIPALGVMDVHISLDQMRGQTAIDLPTLTGDSSLPRIRVARKPDDLADDVPYTGAPRLIVEEI